MGRLLINFRWARYAGTLEERIQLVGYLYHNSDETHSKYCLTPPNIGWYYHHTKKRTISARRYLGEGSNDPRFASAAIPRPDILCIGFCFCLCISFAPLAATP